LKPGDLHIIESVTLAGWNEALTHLPRPHFLQTWEWGVLRTRFGWKVERFLYVRGGITVGAATLLTRKLPLAPWSIAYVPKGPLLDYADESLTAAVLDHICAAAKAAGAVYVKTDPDIAEDNEPFAHLYHDLGWRASDEQIQFPNTALLDLSPGTEALLAAMKPKTRYNIRLASRRGVEVVQTTDWDTLFALYAETALRDGFAIREAGYYHALWSLFQESGQGEGFVARVGDEAVAGLFLMHTGETGWFYSGASSQRHRDTMPNYLLQWHTIQWLCERGYRWYDLWGAPTEMQEDDPLWGVYRFKSGFGAQYVRRLGAYDRVLNKAAHYLISNLAPRFRKLRRLLDR
jgi:lipid II:glycine glycyltransferase (peptidoglycan interpeptide bridge formation enzyme)